MAFNAVLAPLPLSILRRLQDGPRMMQALECGLIRGWRDACPVFGAINLGADIDRREIERVRRQARIEAERRERDAFNARWEA